MKKILIIFIFISTPLLSFSQFQIESKKLEKSYLITWNKYESNLDYLSGYKIYIEEGFLTDRFPENYIDSLDKSVLGWETKERETIDFKGISLRKPKQWGDKEVITNGFFYTIGVERLVKDSITLKEKSQQSVCYILPFEFIPHTESTNNIKGKIHPSKFNILPAPIKSFIRILKDSVAFTFKGEDEIIKTIIEDKDYYYLKLKNRTVKYYKPPKRPEALGNPEIILKSLGLIILAFLVIVVLILVYIFLKSLMSLNYISNNPENIKDILKGILEKDKFSVFIIYVLVLFNNGSIVTKIINNVIKKVSGIELDIFNKKNESLNQISSVYKNSSLFQYKKIEIELGKII